MRVGAPRRAFGSALSVIAAAAVASACASSGSQPTTQPASTHLAGTPAATTAPAKAKEFASKRYGLALTLPQDWSMVDASFAWDGKGLQAPGSPFFANFTSPTGNRTLMAASAKVPKGMHLLEWQSAMVRGHLSSCSKPSSVKATTLGGAPALSWSETCDGGTVNSNKVAAVRGGRGYMIYMPSDAANRAEDRRIFEGIRRSLRFTQ